MSQAFFLVHQTARQRAVEAVKNAPEGWQVQLKEPKRGLAANARMWAMLGDISRQVEWYGKKLEPSDWKHVFSAALTKQRVVPGLDGGFVLLGQSTSAMSKSEFSELIELMFAFGAERGVQWSEPQKEAA